MAYKSFIFIMFQLIVIIFSANATTSFKIDLSTIFCDRMTCDYEDDMLLR